MIVGLTVVGRLIQEQKSGLIEHQHRDEVTMQRNFTLTNSARARASRILSVHSKELRQA